VYVIEGLRRLIKTRGTSVIYRKEKLIQQNQAFYDSDTESEGELGEDKYEYEEYRDKDEEEEEDKDKATPALNYIIFPRANAKAYTESNTSLVIDYSITVLLGKYTLTLTLVTLTPVTALPKRRYKDIEEYEE
jgi:hypothetical protein